MTSSELPNRSGRVLVWDWPTRVFHWSLAICVLSALVTGTLGGGWMPWHGRSGLAIAGLLAFRLVWSVAGNTYARIDLRRLHPAALLADGRGQWKGLGHSPLGTLSVLAMLLVLVSQVISGLFADDDIAFRGPWADAVTETISRAATVWHHRLSDGVMILVALHVAAIAWYQCVRRRDVLRPMLRGWVSGDASRSAQGGRVMALVAAIMFALLVLVIASGKVKQQPPHPPPAVVSPDW